MPPKSFKTNTLQEFLMCIKLHNFICKELMGRERAGFFTNIGHKKTTLIMLMVIIIRMQQIFGEKERWRWPSSMVWSGGKLELTRLWFR